MEFHIQQRYSTKKDIPQLYIMMQLGNNEMNINLSGKWLKIIGRGRDI